MWYIQTRKQQKGKTNTFDTLPRPDVISPTRRFHLSFIILYISIAQEADAAAALIVTLCFV
jgi:hypothetical protein